jgi:hypothetical protein
MNGALTIFCFVCNKQVGVAIEPEGSEREQRKKALDIHYALYHPGEKDEDSKS